MRSIVLQPGGRQCDGLSRRDFLEWGSLALGGLSLPSLLAARADAATADFVRDKSVVVLYLSGGASHIETFDPKMSAPDGTRSITGEVSTPIAGVTFGGTFPMLAAQADKLAIVRSFAHDVGGHVEAHAHVLSGGVDPEGKRTIGHSMGAAFARLRGVNHPRTGLPTYGLLTEKEIDGQYRNERERVIRGSWPGSLGRAYAPFGHEIGWEEKQGTAEDTGGRNRADPTANPLVANMSLNVSPEVFHDRLALLNALDRFNRRSDATGSMDAHHKFTSQAMELITGGAAAAFDLSREDPRSVERYDTSHIDIGHKVFRPSTLGRQMLLARRLCQHGCGFVTVHSAGWDMHADGNNPGIVVGMEMLGRSLDKAVSAFIEDVDRQGLSEKILLVITGDFGRTPKVNKRGGRDHWPRLCTLALAGGGWPMGQVIGRSSRGAEEPAGDPVTLSHLMGTIMQTLFDVGQLRLEPGVPRDLARLITEGEPIPGLV